MSLVKWHMNLETGLVFRWQAGVSVNACDNRMRTPLSEAVEKGHMTIVEVLLKAGANADHKVHYAFFQFFHSVL